ncbi:FtsJ-like methyltransferase [Ceratobasidium sp. AG-Ba]|nr:FtsJ-like methyltransferase [Ceratobasidium sp. AG-Ba]QRW08618.1 FtsJ-like methyltransferase [Ceratobasidium sp. AG-Ba]
MVNDDGSAGWSQVASKHLHIHPNQSNASKSMLIAVDLLPMNPIPGVHFIQGDFMQLATQKRVSELVGARKIDVVLSDMCANVTGTVKDVESSLNLCEMAFGFASRQLQANANARSGTLVMKYFEHPDLLDFMKQKLKPAFENVRSLRLAASRSESSEQYFLCTGFRGS